MGMRMTDLGAGGGITTARKRRAQATRNRLLESALELFKERGYDNVSVDDITSRAGTAKGTFYTYFRTKSDIVIEEFRLVDDYYEEIEPRLRAAGSAAAQLTEFTRHQLEYLHKRVGFQTLGILYMNQLAPVDRVKIFTDPERPLVRIVRGIISYGQKSGEFSRAVDALTLANWVNRAMRGLFLDWAISRGAMHLANEGMLYFTTSILPGLLVRDPSQTDAMQA